MAGALQDSKGFACRDSQGPVLSWPVPTDQGWCLRNSVKGRACLWLCFLWARASEQPRGHRRAPWSSMCVALQGKLEGWPGCLSSVPAGAQMCVPPQMHTGLRRWRPWMG